MKLEIYLFFTGTCAEAFAFYAEVFGTRPSMRMTFAEGPPGMPVAEGDESRLMHISLPIGDSVLMGSDVPAAQDALTQPAGCFAVSVQAEDRAEADRLFAALTREGDVNMPMHEMFWGDYFGMGRDRFGVRWMVNCAA